MKILRCISVIGIMFLIIMGIDNTVYAQIVQVNSMYTYDEMNQDIIELTAAYPGIVGSQSAGITAQGRNIPVVVLGNPSAPHSIMIQSAIHAREYAVSQSTMAIVEYIAQLMSSGQLPDILANTCYYVVPMSNPDGVIISQSIAPSWKANAVGVDLNRNFNCNWQAIIPKAVVPGSEEFKGYSPDSEPEVRALESLAACRGYDCYISYHQQGNIIYYDDDFVNPAVSAASALVASTTSASNGYRTYNLKSTNASGITVMGGFTDWIQVNLGRPAITVECGSGWGAGAQNQVYSIFDRNKNSWIAVARLFYR